MGKFSILLCDSDEVYIKRLAAGLQRQLKDRALIHVITADGQMPDLAEVHLLLVGESAGSFMTNHPKGKQIVLLEEGPEADPDGEGKRTDGFSDSIYKYQSLTKICQALQRYIPAANVSAGTQRTGHRQLWYGVCSPVRHKSVIPFAVSLAQQLSIRKRTLLLLFMEFSGVVSWLGLEQNPGTEAFLLSMRKKPVTEHPKIPLPELYQLPGVDLLNVTDNPMILYELTEKDMGNLIGRIGCCEQYEAVVWVAGNIMRGCMELIGRSEKLFCIEENDSHSRCCQQEFYRFFEKTGADRLVLKRLTLPYLQGMEAGGHLVMQWRESPIGEAAGMQLKGEIDHGGNDTGSAGTDPGQAGCGP